MVRRVLGRAVAVLTLGTFGACGATDVTTDPTVAAFVGTWDADSLTMTNEADTTVVANVLDFGSFVIRVEPSGQYTATLTVLDSPAVEIGDVDVIGSTFQLNRTFPPPPSTAASSFVFAADDYLILDGASQFDFNLDRIAEAARAHFELRRR